MKKLLLLLIAIMFVAALVYVTQFDSHNVASLADLEPFDLSKAELETQSLDRYLDEATRRLDLPGAVAVIMRSDSILAKGAGGIKDRESENPMMLSHNIHLGSNAKAMTAALGWRLQDQGDLDLNKSVKFYLDEHYQVDKSWTKVSLLNLLNHTAGISDDKESSRSVFDRWVSQVDRTQTPTLQREQLVGAITHSPVGQSKGTYQYSNFGYALFGHIVEKHFNVPFESIIAQHLFDPLLMKSTGFGDPGLLNEEQPWGHEKSGTPREPSLSSDNPAMISPAGGINMTLSDWTIYVQYNMQLLQRDSAVFHSGYRDSFAYDHGREENRGYAQGWTFEYSFNDQENLLIEHSGTNTAWYSQAWVSVDRDIAILVAVNQGGTSEQVDAILWRLVESYVSQLAQLG